MNHRRPEAEETVWVTVENPKLSEHLDITQVRWLLQDGFLGPSFMRRIASMKWNAW